ncbi:MAG: serine hydrolase domain-containing protein [Dehalococcoidia bacterium]
MTGQPASSLGRGLTDRGRARIEALFAQQLEAGWHPGAQLAVIRDGVLVLELTGGLAAPGRRLTRDDPMLLFSATKPIAAVCVHLLHERGRLSYDTPVASFWPQFAQSGKRHVTVRHVLTHQGGFPQLAHDFDWMRVDDWPYVTAQTAAIPAAWKPGTAVGYHPITYGWALGEVVRRVDGRMPRDFMRDEVFAPLGIEDRISLGLSGSRVADRVPVFAMSEQTRHDPAGELRATSKIVEVFNTEAMARAQAPAVNGYGTAAALAGFYAGLLPRASGRPLLRSETLAEATHVQAETARDRTQDVPKRYGLGFYLSGLNGDPFDYHEGVGVFGHAGQQSSVGYADPRYGLAVAYITNGLQAPAIVTRRMAEMATALRAACA